MMHLRMTGTLLLDPPASRRATRACASRFDGGRELFFDDPRRFGTGELALGEDAREDVLRRAARRRAVSPDFTSAHLYALTRVSRAPIKAFLLDQRKVAGVGNIYADEALFRAAHPPAAAGATAHAQAGRGAARRASSRRSRRASRPRARRSTTSATPTASRARSRTAS